MYFMSPQAKPCVSALGIAVVFSGPSLCVLALLLLVVLGGFSVPKTRAFLIVRECRPTWRQLHPYEIICSEHIHETQALFLYNHYHHPNTHSSGLKGKNELRLKVEESQP